MLKHIENRLDEIEAEVKKTLEDYVYCGQNIGFRLRYENLTLQWAQLKKLETDIIINLETISGLQHKPVKAGTHE